jgi:Flp pilus assembly protein TadG
MDACWRTGAAAVEFAMTVPIVLMIFLGIVELGRVCMTGELLTEAARRACRVAAVQGTTSSQIKQAALNMLNGVGITSESVGISVNDAPLDSIDPTTMPAGTEMTVVVSVPVSKISWVPTPVYTSGTLSGRFTLRRQ